MLLKEKDFVEIDYTGSVKEDNRIFDTTDKKVAKEAELTEDVTNIEPAIICLGQGQIISGIDKNLVGKEPGEYEFDVMPEDAFGKKDAKLIQLIPTAKFKKQNIKPEPGLNVEVDNMVGKIRAVTGGRTIVDFNHPLSGLQLHYKVKVNRVITDIKEKVSSILKYFLQIEDADITIQDNKAVIGVEKEIPPQVVEFVKPKILEMIGIDDIEFKKLEKNKNQQVKDIPVDKKEVEKS